MSAAPDVQASVQFDPPCVWRAAADPPPASLAELSERLRGGGPARLDDEDALRLACGASAADAVALLAEFGSLPEVLAAPCAALARIVSGTQAAKLALAHDLARRLLECPLRRRSALSSWTAVADYLRGVLAGRPREQFRVLFLDKKNQLIRVRPALSRADQTVAHPLAHQLRPLLAGAPEGVFFHAERLLREPGAALAGRALSRQATETLEPPMGRSTWNLPAGVEERLNGRRESPTSLGRLFNCHLGWLAQDVLGLRPGRFAEVPRPDQLFGNLAHEIARRLLPAGPPPPLAGVRAAASALFEELLPQMAAPLQQPELAGELVAARQLVPAALEALVGLLHDRGLEVVGAELDREGAMGDLALQGRIDLLVKRAPQTAVLDLKWTRSERRYVEEVASGSAVQLAVYGAMGIDTEGVASPGGYFLLQQRRVVAEAGSILVDDPVEAARTEAETLQIVATDWGLWRALAGEGIVVAAGLPDASGHRPEGLGLDAPEEPCRFCELTGLCRINVEAL